MANGGIEKRHPGQGKQQQRGGLHRRSDELIGIFPQARQQLNQIAGEGFRIQLGADQPIPGCGHRIEGTGQHEDERAIGHPSEAAALEAAGANGLEGEHPEELSEAIHGLIEQGSHRLRGAITTGEAGATTADHHLHGWISDPTADLRSDPVSVIGHLATLLQPVARILQALLQGITGGIVGEASPIGHREEGDRKGHSRPTAESPLWGGGSGRVVAVIQTSHAGAR